MLLMRCRACHRWQTHHCFELSLWWCSTSGRVSSGTECWTGPFRGPCVCLSPLAASVPAAKKPFLKQSNGACVCSCTLLAAVVSKGAGSSTHPGRAVQTLPEIACPKASFEPSSLDSHRAVTEHRSCVAGIIIALALTLGQYPTGSRAASR